MQHNQHIAELGPLFTGAGVRHVVICPGSRNAPLMGLFTSGDHFNCHSIVDERSAGYIALGMARHVGQPVVVLTTSGTAVMNLAPAMAEAYHQEIPLVAITADRLVERIPQFNNQWVNQEAPFYLFSKGFYQLPVAVWHEEELERMMDPVLQLVQEARRGPAGPVHLNVALEEPLYDPLPTPVLKFQIPEIAAPEKTPVTEPLSADRRVMVLAGMGHPSEEVLGSLRQLVRSRQAVVIAENISNMADVDFIAHPELLLAHVGEEERKMLVPDLVVSFGGQVVSKRLKLFLESVPDLEIVHASGALTRFLEQFVKDPKPGRETVNSYLEEWKRLEERSLSKACERFGRMPFCSLMAVNRTLAMAPEGTVVHAGNSSIIRYTQLIPGKSKLRWFANRGTSGIDGTVSAAVGAAMVSDDLHLLIVGDLGFVYDSNALWNKDFPPNLKIVVINDGGGGIFRLLEGPGGTDFSEEYQVTHHPVSVELLAQAFGRTVLRASGSVELEDGLKQLFDAGRNLEVLEADTSGCENSRIFKDFLKINPSSNG